MDIAGLGEKVTIQKNVVVVDEIGNRRNEWTDYFTCSCMIGGERGRLSTEKEAAGQVVSDAEMAVTVRYCNKTAVVNALEYRVLFRGEIFNITNVDHMSFKKKALKISCVKVRR